MDQLGLDLFLLALLVLTVLVEPYVGWRDMRGLERALGRGDQEARRRAYRRAIVVQWSVMGILLAAWRLLGGSWAALRLVPRPTGWQWLAIALGLAGLAAYVVYARRLAGDPRQLAAARDQLGRLALIAPRSPREYRWFVGLSATAGVCEELLYRGMLLTSLTAVIGLWPAVVLSSLIFGLGHAYQGVGGVLKTSLAGLVAAGIVLATGSLYVTMIMHAVLDMTQGRLLSAVVSLPDDSDSDPANDFGGAQ